MRICRDCGYCDKVVSEMEKMTLFSTKKVTTMIFVCHRYPPIADMKFICNDGLVGTIESKKIVEVGEMFWCGEWKKRDDESV